MPPANVSRFQRSGRDWCGWRFPRAALAEARWPWALLSRPFGAGADATERVFAPGLKLWSASCVVILATPDGDGQRHVICSKKIHLLRCKLYARDGLCAKVQVQLTIRTSVSNVLDHDRQALNHGFNVSEIVSRVAQLQGSASIRDGHSLVATKGTQIPRIVDGCPLYFVGHLNGSGGEMISLDRATDANGDSGVRRPMGGGGYVVSHCVSMRLLFNRSVKTART